MNRDNNQKWWHAGLEHMASQLSKGILKEMKHRILTSNIQKKRLRPNENTDRMLAFFRREIKRYNNRKETMRAKQQQTVDDKDKLEASQAHVEAYRRIIRKMLTYNKLLAKKCHDDDIPTESVRVWGNVYSRR